MIRLIAVLACLPWAAFGQTAPMLAALRQRAWPVAEALAAANPDPVAPRLVTFIRLLMPGEAGADELRRFMADNPGWPDQPVLERRFAEALADEADEAAVARLCQAHPTPIAAGLARCAAAFALTGQPSAAAIAARAAWISGITDPAEEADFAARWASVLTEADQQRRFEHLEATDPAAAQRQLARLDSSYRPLAAARLALRRDDPDALSFLPSVPQALRADPKLLLAQARFLRRAHAEDAALALWRTALPAAEAAVPSAERPAFWSERDALARRRLAAGDADGAYVLADDPYLMPDQRVDAEFLAGWIATEFLHDAARGRAHFKALLAGSHSAITQARAFYWLGRTGDTAAAARRDYEKAAAWPLTFYGQQALRADGSDDAKIRQAILAARDPTTTSADATAFTGNELARAADILVGWDDPRRAVDFLLRLAQPPAGCAQRVLTAQAALRLGLPDVAVQTARLAGRDGCVLAQSGWPMPVQPPGPVAQPLSLGLMRQESSFDAQTVSPAGAHGLMQLMPQTAQQVARRLHAPPGPLADPSVNMRLGTAYLNDLLEKFGGVVPYAVAAYDAGPRRVQEWIAANGDPAAKADPDAMIDWIELIPFAETRNYVQRVLENRTVYAARLAASSGPQAAP